MTRTPSETQALLDQRNEARERTIAKLTARIAELERRPLFAVKNDFKPEKHLSKEGLEVYTSVWAWYDDQYQNVIQKIQDGKMPYANTPLPEGVIPIRPLRFVKTIVHTLLFMLDHYGDPRALSELKKVVSVIYDPARMATGYLSTSAADRTLEQPGELRFNHIGTDAGKGKDSDLYPLDWCLHASTVAQAKYAFRQNLRLGSGAHYTLLRDYSLTLERRLTFLSAALHPKKPWYTWGSSLRHPTEARFAWHYYEWLDSGDPKHWEAWQQFGVWLEADTERVELDDGSYVLVFPHTVDGWADYMFTDKDKPSAQDVTYTQESISDRLVSMLGGSPFHKPEDEAAMARTMHLCALYKGAKSDTIAATIAGIGTKADTNKRVVIASGKRYATKRVTNSRPTATEQVLQISRGLALTGSYLASERPEFEQALRDISNTPNAHEYKRYGARVGLMYYATPERLGA